MAIIAKGSPAPDFSLKDLHGELVSLSQFRGTPVLLNFYTTNCPWAQTEMPRLGEVYRRLHEHQVNVIVLGVALGSDTPHTVVQFAADKELDFPHVTGGGTELRDAYGIERVPTLVLVNREGAVHCVYEGATEQMPGIVEQTLLAAAGDEELPVYHLVGNGCAPE
jgi:peroxiredoxin